MLETLHKYQNVFKINTDPRAPTDWFLVPVIPFTLSLAAYIAVVQVVLPKFMENRKPYNLKNVLIGYNACQVLVNAYLLYLAADNWFGTPTNSVWRCSPVDRTNNPRALQAIDAVYLYFLSKYTDFFDTFFFILRKKYNQVSFLHVYHHVSTPVFTWFVLKMYPGGSFILFMMLNTFVHVIMYTYYMLAAMGPGIQKYLWWKKYITIIQLVQFTVGITHIALILVSAECNISKVMMCIYTLNGFLFLWLFGKFYVTSYNQNRRKSKILVKEDISIPSPVQSTADSIKRRILVSNYM